MLPDPLDEFLPRLQREDDRLWVRILAQTHWQYGEIPFWVLVETREQIAQALPFLQEALAPLRAEEPDAKVTVAFIGMSPTTQFSYGMFEGDEFFAPDALHHLYDEPFESPRTVGVFDATYPNDSYAIADEERLDVLP